MDGRLAGEHCLTAAPLEISVLVQSHLPAIAGRHGQPYILRHTLCQVGTVDNQYGFTVEVDGAEVNVEGPHHQGAAIKNH